MDLTSILQQMAIESVCERSRSSDPSEPLFYTGTQTVWCPSVMMQLNKLSLVVLWEMTSSSVTGWWHNCGHLRFNLHGHNLGTIFASFWPACLLLLPCTSLATKFMTYFSNGTYMEHGRLSDSSTPKYYRFGATIEKYLAECTVVREYESLSLLI